MLARCRSSFGTCCQFCGDFRICSASGPPLRTSGQACGCWRQTGGANSRSAPKLELARIWPKAQIRSASVGFRPKSAQMWRGRHRLKAARHRKEVAGANRCNDAVPLRAPVAVTSRLWRLVCRILCAELICADRRTGCGHGGPAQTVCASQQRWRRPPDATLSCCRLIGRRQRS